MKRILQTARHALSSKGESHPAWRQAVAMLVAFLLTGVTALPLKAQTIDPGREGYDPMRQITQQILPPNLMLVLDLSGSMANDIAGNWVGVDSVGQPPSARWNVEGINCGCDSAGRGLRGLYFNGRIPGDGSSNGSAALAAVHGDGFGASGPPETIDFEWETDRPDPSVK